MSDSLWTYELYSIVEYILYSPGQNTGVGNLSLLQGIFPTPGSNPGLLHCRQIFYKLSHKWSPRILEWVAYPFSSGSSWARKQTGVSWIAGVFFTNWAEGSPVQSVSCVQLFATPCTPGFPVLHCLPEFAQIHVHWVSYAIQPSHLLPRSSFAFSLSQHQSLFQWVDSSYQVAKVSTRASASTSVFPVNIRGWFPLGLTGLISLPSNELSRVFSGTTIQ